MSNSINNIVKKRTSSASIINDKNLPGDLDSLENQIKTLKNTIKRDIWLVGQRLSKIKDERLYDKKDYKSFEEYCENELEITRQTAYSFIRIFSTFGFTVTSRHDHSKLHEIAKIKDKEKREEVIQKLETDNPSVRELRDIVKEANGISEKNKEPDVIKISYNIKKKFQEINVKTDEEVNEIKNLIKFLEGLVNP